MLSLPLVIKSHISLIIFNVPLLSWPTFLLGHKTHEVNFSKYCSYQLCVFLQMWLTYAVPQIDSVSTDIQTTTITVFAEPFFFFLSGQGQIARKHPIAAETIWADLVACRISFSLTAGFVKLQAQIKPNPHQHMPDFLLSVTFLISPPKTFLSWTCQFTHSLRFCLRKFFHGPPLWLLSLDTACCIAMH